MYKFVLDFFLSYHASAVCSHVPEACPHRLFFYKEKEKKRRNEKKEKRRNVLSPPEA
jgi:hypothetical protein